MNTFLLYNYHCPIGNRLNNMKEAREYFEESLERSKQEAEADVDPQYYNAISVTTNYNLGRIYEGLFMCDKAEKNYKDTLKGCIFFLSQFLPVFL